MTGCHLLVIFLSLNRAHVAGRLCLLGAGAEVGVGVGVGAR